MIQGILKVGKSYITKHGKEVKITRSATEAARVKNGAAFQSDHFTLYKEDGTVALMGADGDIWDIVREALPAELGSILENSFAARKKFTPTESELSLYKNLVGLTRLVGRLEYVETNQAVQLAEETIRQFEEMYPDHII